MLALAGLLLLGPARAETITTQDIARYYEDIWFADPLDKIWCANVLRNVAGEDYAEAKKSGVSIDQTMRDHKCLDHYSYLYGGNVLPAGAAVPRLDSSSVAVIGAYLFIYINTFENDGAALMSAIGKIDPGAMISVKTVVIDVRGNPGGYVSTLEKLLDSSFSPEAGIEYLKVNGRAHYGTHLTTSRKGTFTGLDIRILTDTETASSSEWMIETLCYEWYPQPGKCTTLGSKTLGKSLLQRVWAEANVKLTCGEWFVVNNRAKDQSRIPERIQGIGIEPDKPMKFDCDRFAYECIAARLAEAGL